MSRAQEQPQIPVYNLPPEKRLPPETIRALKEAADARRQHDFYERPDLRPEEPGHAINPMAEQDLLEQARKNSSKSIKTVALPRYAFQPMPDLKPAPSSGALPEASAAYHSGGVDHILLNLLMLGLVMAGTVLGMRKLGRMQNEAD